MSLTTREFARKKARALEAAICTTACLPDLERHYDANTLNAAEDQFGRVSLRDAISLTARENGYCGSDRSDQLEAMFGYATRSDASILAGGYGHSTLSLPGVLGNVATRFMASGFNAVETAWRRVSSVRSVPNFKTISTYRLTDSLEYELVGPAGEIKQGTVGEASYANKADLYGKGFSLDGYSIINDDLGAVTELARKLGRGAALALNTVFWTRWLEAHASFWTADRGNLLTGGGSALASAGLKAASSAMRTQTDENGKPLAIAPRVLLVPPELEIDAETLMTSVTSNASGSGSGDEPPADGGPRAKYRVAVSSYLSNATITGYSTTAWWLVADPRDAASIEVAFLDGRQEPTVEAQEAPFSQLGVMFRGHHSFGAAKTEYRASVRNAGA